MGKPLIFNIQKYSIHDGEGIRTTVFFKGCPLSCRWCHNPESQSWDRELLYYPNRCSGCGACVAACPQKANSLGEAGEAVRLNRSSCEACGTCGEVCPQNAREEAGREYALPDLIRELEKDRMFYEQSGGGITLSGGEALAQDMDYVEELARRLWQKGYSVNFDTCGHVPYENIRRVLPYTDCFLYDLKLLDPEAHKTYTGSDNQLILDNLKRLNAEGGRINIRLPLIQGVNAHRQHLLDTIAFLKDNQINVCRVNLLKYHDTGNGKYGRLGRHCDMSGFLAPGQEWLEQAAALFRQNGFSNVQIGG